MIYRMYGFKGDYNELFQVFKQEGIQSVTSSKNTEAMIIAKECGLKYYICTGAYGSSDEKEYCQSVTGIWTSWFQSGCPNHPDVRERGLKRAEDAAKSSDLDGLIIDGARFSSPASADSLDAFFTCFCPRCMAKMDSLGFDSQSIKNAVSELYHLIAEGIPFNLENRLRLLKDWLTFRRICSTEFLIDYKNRIKAVNPDLEMGIYIFSPSLSDLVGQNYQDISSIVDFISPMIYRHFKYPQGPACLDHEIATLSKYFEDQEDDVKELIIKTFTELTGVDYSAFGKSGQLLKEGVLPEVIGLETKKTISLSGDCPVIPIILLDDIYLEDSMKSILDAVDQVDFYTYNPTNFSMAQPVLRKYRNATSL